MPLVLITPPAEEPVSATEAIDHLRLDDWDGNVPRIITAAREWVEKYLGRALVTQTWELVLDEFPLDAIVLAKGKASALTSVTYYDVGGTLRTLAPTAYQFDDAREPARVLPAPSTSWPDTQAERVNAVRVRFVAGYGLAAAVPAPIKSAVLLLVGHLYDHREIEITGVTSTPLHFAIDALLSPYRLGWVP